MGQDHTAVDLDFSAFCDSVRAVRDYARDLKCEAFNQKLIAIDWFREYIKHQPNISLFEDEELPEESLAVTLKRRVEIKGQRRSLFLILIRPIADRVLKQFVVAHELGHVLLHGRLMHPGMLFRRAKSGWDTDYNVFERALEIEANVYALMSLIPTKLLTVTEKYADLNPSVVQDVVTRLYDHCVDYGIVRERLLIHGVLESNRSAVELAIEFGELLLKRPSWSITGASTVQEKQLACTVSDQRLADSDFESIRDELADAGVLPEPDPLNLMHAGGFGLARVNERF